MWIVRIVFANARVEKYMFGHKEQAISFMKAIADEGHPDDSYWVGESLEFKYPDEGWNGASLIYQDNYKRFSYADFARKFNGESIP